ncbi:unnamed protein product [Clonostachys rosea]|uniref:Uncharacterized protein n=1 Tax=Bionectria ochroleuca TaxID=29856 RepID=A0ABY6UTY4_BIOOC|nr:unnamed protein product [Clonostachys rosea]
MGWSVPNFGSKRLGSDLECDVDEPTPKRSRSLESAAADITDKDAHTDQANINTVADVDAEAPGLSPTDHSTRHSLGPTASLPNLMSALDSTSILGNGANNATNGPVGFALEVVLTPGVRNANSNHGSSNGVEIGELDMEEEGWSYESLSAYEDRAAIVVYYRQDLRSSIWGFVHATLPNAYSWDNLPSESQQETSKWAVNAPNYFNSSHTYDVENVFVADSDDMYNPLYHHWRNFTTRLIARLNPKQKHIDSSWLRIEIEKRLLSMQTGYLRKQYSRLLEDGGLDQQYRRLIKAVMALDVSMIVTRQYARMEMAHPDTNQVNGFHFEKERMEMKMLPAGMKAGLVDYVKEAALIIHGDLEGGKLFSGTASPILPFGTKYEHKDSASRQYMVVVCHAYSKSS